MLMRLGAALAVPAVGGAVRAAPVIVELQGGGARLELQFAEGFDAALRQRARVWVERSVAAIVGYFGRFPVPDVELLMQPVAGGGVRGGTAFSHPAPYVRLRLGVDTSSAQFDDDWVLVHEMVHLGVPRVPRRQSWLHEGLATYVEGIARTRAGQMSAATLWHAMQRDMPQGQPQGGDEGLDHTPTWGRTYWGGALFCLLADVQIRRRSGARLGLEHALRGVLAAGGSYAVAWPLPRILEVGDAAIGQTTLAELYALTKDCPAPIDLAALWADLGVVERGGTVELRGDAPLAAVRRAIAG
ncbi:hypothetical protein HLB44_31130 [Aquincola sp. S2]|uniref:Peptidase M61 catalytic domain-containing protein n=2 Tax=Pseudaquabacterium terrae TaxID=2732868 RepID=A0ABX2ERY1_9BURK|nr:hypothetical protein [Aquabacterium terrae]